MPGKGQNLALIAILFIFLAFLISFTDSLHPKLNYDRMVELFEHYGGETNDSIQSLVNSVNRYHYCTNKIRAAKRWAKTKSRAYSSEEENDESFDAVLYVEAMCIANAYTMGQVYPALRDNGPLNVQLLDKLRANYTRDYAEKYGSDAMYAFTWFIIDYMRLLNYEENALVQTNNALAIVRQRFAPKSLAEMDLLRAYRILIWHRLYSSYPRSATESDIFIFNKTIEHILQYWKAEEMKMTSDLAQTGIHK